MDTKVTLLSVLLFLGATTPAMALQSVAPDAGGYTYIDNHEVGGPVFNFEDISGTGTPFTLSDDSTSDIAIPFTFYFYDLPNTSVRVSSNGFISFDNTANGCCTGHDIPVDDEHNNLIAAWWEDLNPTCAGAGQHWQVLGTAPDRRLVIQHTNTPSYNCDPGNNTFQYKLFEGRDDVEVHYQSLTSGDTGTFTIGIEAPNGATGQKVYLGSGLTPPYTSDWAIQYSRPVYDFIVDTSMTGNTSETGGTTSFTIVLTAEPSDLVTIDFTVSDTSEATITSSVVFDATNWDDAQTVTITGLDDLVDDGAVEYTVGYTITTDDLLYASQTIPAIDALTVTNLDNDTAGFIVDTSMTGSTSEEGRSTTFTIALSSEPTDTVTIDFTVSNTMLATITDSISFDDANWTIPRTITLTGLDHPTSNTAQKYTVNYTVTSPDANYDSLTIPALDSFSFVNTARSITEFVADNAPSLIVGGPSAPESGGGGTTNPLLLLAMSGLFLIRRRRKL